MNKKILKNLIAVVSVVATINSFADTPVGTHGGQWATQKSDMHIRYEVVHDPLKHQFKIYAPTRKTNDLPSKITLNIKKDNTLLNKVHLTLATDAGPDAPAYSGAVPANITIGGGITYDIDF